MNDANNSKSRVGLYIFIVVLLVMAAVGFTYAYFTTVVTKPNGDTNTDVVTGKLNVDFETSEYINNNSAMLIKDSEKATKADKTLFSIKHATNSNVVANYDVYLVITNISSNFKSSDLKWELLQEDSIIASGNFASVGSATELKLNSSAINLPLESTHNCEFRMWLSETDENQLSLLEGNFSGKIKVVAVNVPVS